MMLLNDGIIRVLSWSEHLGPFELGNWLRAAIQGHYESRRDESATGLPGLRTVISSGWLAEHSFAEVRVDDLVADYTRQKTKTGLSKLAEITGNPVIVSSPAPLQLNTAFSRSFLLNEAGSRAGLSGACLYLDGQFLEDVTVLFESYPGFQIIRWVRDNDMVFAVEDLESAKQHCPVGPNEVRTKDEWARRLEEEEREAAERGYRVLPESSGRRPWAFGFLLEKPAIEVNLPNMRTKVHRVVGFFPSDEDPADFMLELWS